jgi:hypothetical protein
MRRFARPGFLLIHFHALLRMQNFYEVSVPPRHTQMRVPGVKMWRGQVSIAPRILFHVRGYAFPAFAHEEWPVHMVEVGQPINYAGTIHMPTQRPARPSRPPPTNQSICCG